MTTETLGRFGHHPDHALDFCVEVEAIEGEIADIAAGLTPTMNLDERITKAMTFRVGGDAPSIASKTALRAIEASRRAAPEAAEPVATDWEAKILGKWTHVKGAETAEHLRGQGYEVRRAPTDSQAGRDAVEAAAQIPAQGCPVAWFSRAVHDLTVERLRQVEAEGWTLGHDDEHGDGALAEAAGCYAQAAACPRQFVTMCPGGWPWEASAWKAADPRRMLVKAGALILAEIERLDRLSTPTGRAAE